MDKLANKLCNTEHMADIFTDITVVCNNIEKPYVTFYAAKTTSMATHFVCSCGVS